METFIVCMLIAIVLIASVGIIIQEKRIRRKYSVKVMLYEKNGDVEGTYEGTFTVYKTEDVIDALYRWLGLVYYYNQSKYDIKILSLSVTK